MAEFYKRNLGFFSEAEQQRLGKSCVSIAGVGGDGFQLGLKLAMMGVKEFKVADPEVFESENSNRVLGATALAIGMNKAEVFKQRVLELRPDARVKFYTDGVTEDNSEDFMNGADLVIDETDLLYPHLGTMIAREARKRQIPDLFAMNIGFSGVATSFKPNANYWTFERAMGIPKDAPLDEVKDMQINFTRALPYLPSYGDLETLKSVMNGASLPSITQGVDIASGIGSTEAFLHLVNKGNDKNHRRQPTWAPFWKYYDAYNGKSGNYRLNVANIGFYGSLSKVAIRNALNLVPKASYVNISTEH